MDILGVTVGMSTGLGVVHVCVPAKVKLELASKCVCVRVCTHTVDMSLVICVVNKCIPLHKNIFLLEENGHQNFSANMSLQGLIVYYTQVVTVVGVVLNGANVVGYVKCRRDAGTKLTSMAGQLLGQQILKQVTTRLEDCCYGELISSSLCLLGLSSCSRDQMMTQ